MPRCSAHSPTDQTDGALVRSASSTTMPRLTVMPGRARERRLGAHARRDDDARAGSSSPSSSTTRSASIRAALRPSRQTIPCASSARCRIARGAGVELLAHELAGELDDRDDDAVGAQPGGGLEAEQPAADDDRAGSGRRGGERVGVAPGAKHVDMREVDARHRRNERPRAGREHERVVRVGDAGVVDDRARPRGRSRRRGCRRAGRPCGRRTTPAGAARARRARTCARAAWRAARGCRPGPGSSPSMTIFQSSAWRRRSASSTTASPAIPVPTTTSRFGVAGARRRTGSMRLRTRSSRTATAFSSGCLEVGSTAPSVSAFSAPAPATACIAPQ